MKRLEHDTRRRQWSPGWGVACAGLTLACLAGCAVGPTYKEASVDVPDHFRFTTNQPDHSLGDLPWWQVFQDPILLDLINTAVTNNYDLRRAVARVEQARNLAVVARAPLFPQVG